MRLSISKAEAMALSQKKKVDHPLQGRNESLPQVKDFKYLFLRVRCG